MADNPILPRKFYRITGLHNVFTVTDNIYNINTFSLSTFYKSRVNEHTILFLTADAEDAGKKVPTASADGTEDVLLYENMTMIWGRGGIYAIENKTVKNVYYDKNNLTFTIKYTDGTENQIVTSALGYTGGDNINIDENNVISALGYLFDDKNNFVINPNANSANGQTGAVIAGVYPYTGDKNDLLIIGAGESNMSRSNALTVNKTGTVTAKTDVVASANGNNYKLSDIHEVYDSDWAFIG